MICLFIIEDQPVALKSLVKLMSSFDDIEITGTALSGEEAISEMVTSEEHPDVLLCDLGLPGMSGIETIKRIKAICDDMEILVFSVFEDEDKVFDAMQAGASGYILKGSSGQRIHDAIYDVYNGGTVIQPNLARRLLKSFAMPEIGVPSEVLARKGAPMASSKAALSVRELEILQLIAKGLSNHEVGAKIYVADATIKTHLEHIYRKLSVNNRVLAVTEGLRRGIIDL